jgi:DNA-binding response OmpR family regulator
MSRLIDQARGFDLGAVEYILKPFNPLEPAARVRGVLKRLRERDELRREKISELHASGTRAFHGTRTRLPDGSRN